LGEAEAGNKKEKGGRVLGCRVRERRKDSRGRKVKGGIPKKQQGILEASGPAQGKSRSIWT